MLKTIGWTLKDNLKVGTEIYFGGDQANSEGFGVITHAGNLGYGDFVHIKMKDGREFPQVSVCGFSEKYLGHGGTRFVTKKAYLAFRNEQIRAMRERQNKRQIARDLAQENREWKIRLLCDKITGQRKDRLRALNLNCEANTINAQATYKIRRKYTLIDIGQSGKYMINDQGEIFGIKAYGVIHLGHFYGTLDTIDDYYWGDYTAYKLNK